MKPQRRRSTKTVVKRIVLRDLLKMIPRALGSCYCTAWSRLCRRSRGIFPPPPPQSPAPATKSAEQEQQRSGSESPPPLHLLPPKKRFLQLPPPPPLHLLPPKKRFLQPPSPPLEQHRPAARNAVAPPPPPPPENPPAWLREVVAEEGLTEVRFVTCKVLTKSDIAKVQCRLQLHPGKVDKVLLPALTPDEKAAVLGRGIAVYVKDGLAADLQMDFKFYVSVNKYRFYKKGWLEFCGRHGLKADEHAVYIWSFRKPSGKIAFAMDVVAAGGEEGEEAPQLDVAAGVGQEGEEVPQLDFAAEVPQLDFAAVDAGGEEGA